MKIRLPVTYEVSGFVDVEAESIEKAIDKFYESIDYIPLPTDTDYIDGSFQLSTEEPEYIKLYQEGENYD